MAGRRKTKDLFSKNEWDFVLAWAGDDEAAARKIGLVGNSAHQRLLSRPHVVDALRQKQAAMVQRAGELLGDEAVAVMRELFCLFVFRGEPMPAERPAGPLVVYLAQCGEKYRLGATRSQATRLHVLQSESSAPVSLVDSWTCDDAHQRVAELRKRFA